MSNLDAVLKLTEMTGGFFDSYKIYESSVKNYTHDEMQEYIDCEYASRIFICPDIGWDAVPLTDCHVIRGYSDFIFLNIPDTCFLIPLADKYFLAVPKKEGSICSRFNRDYYVERDGE